MSSAHAGKVTGVDAAAAAIAAFVSQKTVQFADAVGIETVAYLVSLTSEMRPPAGSRTYAPMTRRTVSPGRLAGGPIQRRLAARSTLGHGSARRAHPGHWADVTGQLAASYSSSARATTRGAMLTLKNSAAYAVELEKHDGYWVLTGVTDAGGPVDQSIAKLSAQFGFTLVRVT
jgi:hypothetical protein